MPARALGLGNKFLANIREVDAIVHVIRCFDDDNIVHVEGKVNPVSDKEIIDIELQLKDLEAVDKKIQKIAKAAQVGDAKAKAELEILKRYKTALEAGKSARTVQVSPEEREAAIGDISLLTVKPVIYVANVDEGSLPNGNAYSDMLREAVKDEGADPQPWPGWGSRSSVFSGWAPATSRASCGDTDWSTRAPWR